MSSPLRCHTCPVACHESLSHVTSPLFLVTSPLAMSQVPCPMSQVPSRVPSPMSQVPCPMSCVPCNKSPVPFHESLPHVSMCPLRGVCSTLWSALNSPHGPNVCILEVAAFRPAKWWPQKTRTGRVFAQTLISQETQASWHIQMGFLNSLGHLF